MGKQKLTRAKPEEGKTHSRSMVFIMAILVVIAFLGIGYWFFSKSLQPNHQERQMDLTPQTQTRNTN